jgi:hypothetical protein
MNSIDLHARARNDTRKVIEGLYKAKPRVSKAEREAILKGVESALRDYERSFPHRPRPA